MELKKHEEILNFESKMTPKFKIGDIIEIDDSSHFNDDITNFKRMLCVILSTNASRCDSNCGDDKYEVLVLDDYGKPSHYLAWVINYRSILIDDSGYGLKVINYHYYNRAKQEFGIDRINEIENTIEPTYDYNEPSAEFLMSKKLNDEFGVVLTKRF